MFSSEVEDWLRRRGWTIIAAALAAVFLWQSYRWWVRPPAVEYDNLRYVQLLSTAISARNAEWLRKVKEAVAHRHQAGEMTDRELRAFDGIVWTAAEGNWQQAERDCFRLAEAQLSRRRSRSPTNDHDHAPRRELTRTP